MVIKDGMIGESMISFTVKDGEHKQTFSKHFTGVHKDDKSDMERLLQFAKGLRELGVILERQISKGKANTHQHIPLMGSPKTLESFGISGDGSLTWDKRKMKYEYYKIYHEPGKPSHHTYHPMLLTETEAGIAFDCQSNMEYGKTGRCYDPTTKTHYTFEKSPTMTRIP